MGALKKLNKTLPRSPSHLKVLFDEYRQRYYALNPLDKDYLYALKNLLLEYCFIFKAKKKNKILETKLSTLPQICKQRKEKARLYQKLLSHPLITKPSVLKGTVAWRYSFRMTKHRDEFLEACRAKGIDCSSWYMNNEKIFDAEISPQSALIEKEIVNLWCDESISKKQIKENIKTILAMISSSQYKG